MKKGSSYRYKKPVKSRFILAFSFFVICFILLIARLFTLQVIKHKYYGNIAENGRTAIVTLPPGRGLIFDRNLTELAMNVPRYSVYAVPRYIGDKDCAAEDIARLFSHNYRY